MAEEELSSSEQTQTKCNKTESFTQTEIDSDQEELESQSLSHNAALEADYSGFNEAYRNGNFGTTRGRVNLKLAKRWSTAHFLVSVFLLCLAITYTSVSTDHRFDERNLVSAFSSISILSGLVGLVTSYCSMYFARRLAKLRRPLFFLLLVRLMCFLECVLVNGGIILVLVVVGTTRAVPGVRVLCVFLVLAMIADWITAMIWLFHWWRCCPCLECLKSLAIFEPGQPLSEGVPDPRDGFISECAHVCWTVYRNEYTTLL